MLLDLGAHKETKMTTVGKRNDDREFGAAHRMVSYPFDQIDSPGLYVESETGALLRVSEEALGSQDRPTLEVVTKSPWRVTKISDDVSLPVAKARNLALERALFVNF
jgi:hypothetical protein